MSHLPSNDPVPVNTVHLTCGNTETVYPISCKNIPTAPGISASENSYQITGRFTANLPEKRIDFHKFIWYSKKEWLKQVAFRNSFIISAVAEMVNPYKFKEKRLRNMAQIDLSKYGITGTTEIVYNPSYEVLFEEETKPELTGYEKGQVSELGAVNVMTGIYTGRSPKDKFIVMDDKSKDTVWWTSDEYKNDNHPATQEAWTHSGSSTTMRFSARLISLTYFFSAGSR